MKGNFHPPAQHIQLPLSIPLLSYVKTYENVKGLQGQPYWLLVAKAIFDMAGCLCQTIGG